MNYLLVLLGVGFCLNNVSSLSTRVTLVNSTPTCGPIWIDGYYCPQLNVLGSRIALFTTANSNLSFVPYPGEYEIFRPYDTLAMCGSETFIKINCDKLRHGVRRLIYLAQYADEFDKLTNCFDVMIKVNTIEQGIQYILSH